MYHSAWEVGELTDLVRARRRLIEAHSLVGSSDHGVSLSLYAKDPDGLEFEVFWTVPGGRPAGTRALDLEGELARRGIPMPQEIDVAPSTCSSRTWSGSPRSARGSTPRTCARSRPTSSARCPRRSSATRASSRSS